MTTSFAETTFKPALRRQLERLAQWNYLGRLASWSECCEAATIRRLAPTLTASSDTEVLRAFGALSVEVLVRDTLKAEAPDSLELAAAQLGVDCTLAALVPGEVL